MADAGIGVPDEQLEWRYPAPWPSSRNAYECNVRWDLNRFDLKGEPLGRRMLLKVRFQSDRNREIGYGHANWSDAPVALTAAAAQCLMSTDARFAYILPTALLTPQTSHTPSGARLVCHAR